MDGRKRTMPPVRPVKRPPQTKKKSSGLTHNPILIIAIVLILVIGLVTALIVKYKPHELIYNSYVQILEKTSRSLGFVINNVEVHGNQRTKKVDIIASLAIQPKAPLYTLDLSDLAQRLQKLTWIKQALIQRQWPDTLKITIQERSPFALWQTNNKLQLVDREGIIIPTDKVQDFYSLPHIIGQDAPANCAQLLVLMAKHPRLQSHITAHVYVDKRRWDLIYKRSVRIKLPAEDIEPALEHLEKLEEKGHIHKDNVVSIDVRVPQRTYFELSPKALSQQMKTVEPKR